MPAYNPYSALGQAVSQQGPTAQPVHHLGGTDPRGLGGPTGQPTAGSPSYQGQMLLKQIEAQMQKFPVNSGAYNRLMQMRAAIMADLADMDVEHEAIEQGPSAVTETEQGVQDFERKAAPYKRQMIPRPVQ
jgi:hypothetical protein